MFAALADALLQNTNLIWKYHILISLYIQYELNAFKPQDENKASG